MGVKIEQPSNRFAKKVRHQLGVSTNQYMIKLVTKVSQVSGSFKSKKIVEKHIT